MTDRQSIAAYIQARADKVRPHEADVAVHLDALAQDIHNEFDLPDVPVLELVA